MERCSTDTGQSPVAKGVKVFMKPIVENSIIKHENSIDLNKILDPLKIIQNKNQIILIGEMLDLY